MPHKEFFEREPADSREAIMQATFHVLWEQGYSKLSLQRIADKTDLHKSTLYHHFDTKEELLNEFLDYVIKHGRDSLFTNSDTRPEKELKQFLDMTLVGAPSNVDEAEAVNLRAVQTTLLVELRSVAVHDDVFRDRFSELDALLIDHLSTIIHRGIEQGEFVDVNVRLLSENILSLCMGSVLRRETSNGKIAPSSSEDLRELLSDRLIASQSS
ncbi:TetR/AcrR family transcriptional regulator (plasmid) [Haloferacaceae archaeon DSL9]